jgi:NADP-dependent 3-hydroxy acid dehydrogenase YdfG
MSLTVVHMTDTRTHPTSTLAPFAGRIAVVTGASSGIGAAIAAGLADRGATVAAVARRADRLAELGEGTVAVPADVTDPAQVAAAFDRVVAEVGPPDLVVANAGVMLPAPIAEARLEDWIRMIDLNLGGLAATIAAAVPHLIAAAADGRTADLVVVSSIGDTNSFPGYAAYGATKAATTTFLRQLRMELAPLGVRSLLVRPGLVATELASNVAHDGSRTDLEAYLGMVAALAASDVADAVAGALSLPGNVCVAELTVVPTGQPFSA